MTKFRQANKQLIALILLSVLAITCGPAQAADNRISSLIKVLNSSRLSLGTQEIIAASLIRESSFESDQLDRIDLHHVASGPLSQENTFHLTSGNALFTPKKDIVVITAFGRVCIGSGSAVCILKPEPGVVAVYNLHSGNGKKVSVEIGQQCLSLFPGVQATICYQVCDFETVNPAKRIAYRNLQGKDLPAGIRVYSAEFSIPSAIEHISPLRSILSSNNKDDQKLADLILKDFVIADQLADTDVPYTVAQEPAPEASPTITANVHIDETNGQLVPNALIQ